MASRRARMRRRHKPRIVARGSRSWSSRVDCSLFSTAATAFGSALVQSWLKDLPDADARRKVAQATKIYSADGKLLARLYLENREVVPLVEISPHLRTAVVAVEDERFYQHQGFDTVGIVRALRQERRVGQRARRAPRRSRSSTSGRRCCRTRPRRSPSRARSARSTSRRSSRSATRKDEILAMYLNTVYFGDGAYGAEAASQALLQQAGEGRSRSPRPRCSPACRSRPTRLNPLDKENLPRATERQHWVLAKMLDQGYITRGRSTARRSQRSSKFQSAPETEGRRLRRRRTSSRYVKKLLQDKYGTSRRVQGRSEGLHDDRHAMQRAAEKARDEHARPSRATRSCALVSIDPKTGYIKAMVGGKDFNKNKFNLATQGKRQPGSSFKMFTLVTALEKGIPPYRAFDSDSPAVIHDRGAAPDWVVCNSEGHGSGYITLEKATANSVNTVFARLIDELGRGRRSPRRRSGWASRATSRATRPSRSAARTCTPLEMASAYGTLAANGVHAKPTRDHEDRRARRQGHVRRRSPAASR